MRFLWHSCLLLLPFAAHADQIGSVDTAFKLLGPDHKVIVEVFDDPKVAGVACYLSRAKTGGIITTEAPIHVSNVMIIDPEDGRPTRIGFRKEKVEKRRPDGSTYEAERSVRISRRTGKDI